MYSKTRNVDFKRLNMSVKKWYIKTYSTDKLGEQLYENTKFINILDCLMNKSKIYERLGINTDSIIRGRIFEELADILNVDYDDIHNLWLNGATDNE